MVKVADRIAYRQLISIFCYQEISEFFVIVLATAVVLTGLKIIVDVIIAAGEDHEQGVGNVLWDFLWALELLRQVDLYCLLEQSNLLPQAQCLSLYENVRPYYYSCFVLMTTMSCQSNFSYRCLSCLGKNACCSISIIESLVFVIEEINRVGAIDNGIRKVYPKCRTCTYLRICHSDVQSNLIEIKKEFSTSATSLSLPKTSVIETPFENRPVCPTTKSMP